jgi:SAM-dependent methyltransferase
MMTQLKQQLKQAYDQKAEDRDHLSPQPWKIAERLAFLQHLQQANAETLLEIGAGPGQDSLFFQQNGLTVTCTDLSPEMVRLCCQKGLNAQVMDFTALQFPPNSFEAVFARNCLLHLPKADWPAVLQSIHTILKPAGLFYLGLYGGYDHEGVWDDDSYEPKRFFTFYTDAALQATLAPYFTPLYFKPIPLEDNPRSPYYQSLILIPLPLELP